MPMWEEWRITVWPRSLEIVAHRECAVEAGRRNGGKKVSSKPPCLNLCKNRREPIEKKKKKVSAEWDPKKMSFFLMQTIRNSFTCSSFLFRIFTTSNYQKINALTIFLPNFLIVHGVYV